MWHFDLKKKDVADIYIPVLCLINFLKLLLSTCHWTNTNSPNYPICNLSQEKKNVIRICITILGLPYYIILSMCVL